MGLKHAYRTCPLDEFISWKLPCYFSSHMAPWGFTPDGVNDLTRLRESKARWDGDADSEVVIYEKQGNPLQDIPHQDQRLTIMNAGSP